jgi:hypothetical protein
MTTKAALMGRLALRSEGENWNAYYAVPGTMEGAIFLGSVRLGLVPDELRRRRFINCMREFVGDLFEREFGVRPTWPDGPQPAPESERTRE